jgi:hypothetical protein
MQLTAVVESPQVGLLSMMSTSYSKIARLINNGRRNRITEKLNSAEKTERIINVPNNVPDNMSTLQKLRGLKVGSTCSERHCRCHR